MVGCEHHAERRQDCVEATVLEWQVLSVGEREGDIKAFGSSSLRAVGEEALDVVGRGDVGAAPGRRERRVAIAGGDVEDLLVPVDVARFCQVLTDDLQGRADHRVVPA